LFSVKHFGVHVEDGVDDGVGLGEELGLADADAEAEADAVGVAEAPDPLFRPQKSAV
jgi:hypothetical protein